MDQDESRGLLKSVLGYFARKPPETTAPAASLRSQAWMRADAYLQSEAEELDDVDPEQVARTLRAFENLIQNDSLPGSHRGSTQDALYPKLRAIHGMHQRTNPTGPAEDMSVRISKRKRENDAAIQELSHLDREAKKLRVLPRDEPSGVDVEEPDADFAMLMRKHSVLLDNALRSQWQCVCQKCSGLSVRLSLPPRKNGSTVETCFEVFFGVRSPMATTLQEARITVREAETTRRVSDPAGMSADIAQLCQNITESLHQQNCLHFALEDGFFRRLRPRPKTFGNDSTPRRVSLSAFFKHQQELRANSSAIPLKGKRILAVTLASALLPFLETPWVQPSFNHSKIQFFQPLRNVELPDITKPFMAMEHIPIISASKPNRGNTQSDNDDSKHMIHPNASVLALGILLCELHYCTPVELMQKDPDAARNVNTDYYTSLDVLKDLEGDAGVDYYLATKACLNWEYYPTGEPADFDSKSVQRLFYQNVIKRLEAEIFKSWRLGLEDLDSLDSRENELCWGVVGREVIRMQTTRPDPSVTANGSRAGSLPLPSEEASSSTFTYVPPQLSRIRAGEALNSSTTKSLRFFDASHLTVSAQETGLSNEWMDSLMMSLYNHVDSFDMLEPGNGRFEPVRIAILDSGFDPGNPLLRSDVGNVDPRIQDARSFVSQTESFDVQDELGHGTHALGLLLKFSTCAQIYIARVARKATLDRGSYDDIAKAINYAVNEWNVDIISMSFGIREHHEPMKEAIQNALHKKTLLFAAASNDGANRVRAFPAQYPSVFCIHSTDGLGNHSKFNPTPDERDFNFALLGENVVSHWPSGMNGHNDSVNAMSGTSVATPIAASLAASVLSFVRQQERDQPQGSNSLARWLKDDHSMEAIFKSMLRQRREGYDYITPHLLFDPEVSREHVYNKIKDIKRTMYV